MTLDRYNALQRFWRKWPPIQITMANYVGYKPAPVDEEDGGEGGDQDGEMDDESMAALIEMFGPLPKRKRQEEADNDRPD